VSHDKLSRDKVITMIATFQLLIMYSKNQSAEFDPQCHTDRCVLPSKVTE